MNRLAVMPTAPTAKKALLETLVALSSRVPLLIDTPVDASPALSSDFLGSSEDRSRSGSTVRQNLDRDSGAL
jgi:hypothetical protein